jgi:hypothetical protein
LYYASVPAQTFKGIINPQNCGIKRIILPHLFLQSALNEQVVGSTVLSPHAFMFVYLKWMLMKLGMGGGVILKVLF